MIEIDGSVGYGQILRTSIALSALTLKPVKIINIRKQRPKPGLMAQHITGVRIAGEFCNADIRGLELGSTEIEFIPKSMNVTDRKIDIGTSGSISLLLQTLTPLLIFADRPVTLEIKGGTAGLGSPTTEYLKHVTYPILSKLGMIQPEIEVLRQGFYPKGNGLVKVKFHPAKELTDIQLTDRGKVKSINGISIAGRLPKSVADRQTDAAKKILTDRGFNVDIESQAVDTMSPGTSITLWSDCDNTIIGSDNIGKIGVRAEDIGKECALELIKSLDSNTALDKFMSDQILIFLSLAKGRSRVSVEDITEHCRTNISAIEKILGVKFEVDGQNKEISINGYGYEKHKSFS